MTRNNEKDNTCTGVEVETVSTIQKKKIFIPTIGTLGDVKPFIILGEQLKKRGHIVWIGVHKRYEELVKQAGLDSIGISGDLEVALTTTADGIEIQQNPSLFKIHLLTRIFQPLVEQWFNAVRSGMKDVDLVVPSVGSVWVALACLEYFPKVKAVGIYTFPVLKTGKVSPPSLGLTSRSLFNWINLIKWKLVDFTISRIYSDKINELRSNMNMMPIKLNYLQLVQRAFGKPMASATIYSKHLLPRPDDWQENDDMVGAIFEEESQNFEPSTAIREFLNKWKNEKVIYVDMGSMMSVMFQPNEQNEFINKLLSSITNSNVKAIISLVGFQNIDKNKLSNDENIFYLTHSIPHSWLFLCMSATIHHGGAGTTHSSLRYGLPTLVLFFVADQPFNGDRIFINKVGPKPISIRETSINKLTNALHDLCNDNFDLYRRNARKISELMKDEDGLGQCIRLIETELTD